MTLRATKLLLVFGVAVFYTLVVFNNITDYGSDYEFVRHVLMMDSTFPGNNGMWRAIHSCAPCSSRASSVVQRNQSSSRPIGFLYVFQSVTGANLGPTSHASPTSAR